jgi:hypothetical protein
MHAFCQKASGRMMSYVIETLITVPFREVCKLCIGEMAINIREITER